MRALIVLIFCGVSCLHVRAQNDSIASKNWKFSSDLNFYFIPNDFIILPVIRADKNKLHLEARYNYEDLNTASVWAGYNFAGGKAVEFEITPMAGLVMGQSQGIAPGVEMTFTRKKFELTSETEFLIDTQANENNFLYTWTDLNYSIKDWLWVGISAQRTRLYKTNLDIQRGILVGAGYKKLEVTAYLYNLGFDTAFSLVTLTMNF
jgi:hypothetical protein